MCVCSSLLPIALFEWLFFFSSSKFCYCSAKKKKYTERGRNIKWEKSNHLTFAFISFERWWRHPFLTALASVHPSFSVIFGMIPLLCHYDFLKSYNSSVSVRRAVCFSFWWDYRDCTVSRRIVEFSIAFVECDCFLALFYCPLSLPPSVLFLLSLFGFSFLPVPVAILLSLCCQCSTCCRLFLQFFVLLLRSFVRLCLSLQYL